MTHDDARCKTAFDQTCPDCRKRYLDVLKRNRPDMIQALWPELTVWERASIRGNRAQRRRKGNR